MRRIGLLLCLTMSAQAIAQVPARSQPEPAFSAKGAFFAISVPDGVASAGWYRDKFGMMLAYQAGGDQGGPFVSVMEGGGLIVEIEAPSVPPGQPGSPANKRSHEPGIFKAGFVVDDFDATFAKLKARGVAIAYGPYAKTDKQRANVIIRDNSGNLIQIFGPR